MKLFFSEKQVKTDPNNEKIKLLEKHDLFVYRTSEQLTEIFIIPRKSAKIAIFTDYTCQKAALFNSFHFFHKQVQ